MPICACWSKNFPKLYKNETFRDICDYLLHLIVVIQVIKFVSLVDSKFRAMYRFTIFYFIAE